MGESSDTDNGVAEMLSQFDVDEIDIAVISGSLLDIFRHADSWYPSYVDGSIALSDGRTYNYKIARVNK